MIDEGYIKFDCQWIKRPLLDSQSIEALNSARHRMYDLGFIGAYPDGIGFGNISYRLDSYRFLISGSATGNFPTLNASHYSVVTDFDIKANRVVCQGPIRASSESMSHAVIYQHCPEVRVVIHIHSLTLWEKYYDELPATAADITYGTPEMANAIKELLRISKVRNQEKVFLMRGHKEGLFAFGSTFEEAEEKLMAL